MIPTARVQLRFERFWLLISRKDMCTFRWVGFLFRHVQVTRLVFLKITTPVGIQSHNYIGQYRILMFCSCPCFGHGLGQGLIFTTHKLILPALFPNDKAGLNQCPRTEKVTQFLFSPETSNFKFLTAGSHPPGYFSFFRNRLISLLLNLLPISIFEQKDVLKQTMKF